ncbi:hypothetical protein ACTJK4_06245 [Ralstonia sp. 22111]|uniref:hypothetical protein n=1 Tax=Ralstonia sp. 22111 TaxID=3453878 RepID=UPI003F84794D
MDQDKLLGYIIAGIIGFIFWLIQQRLEAKPKLTIRFPHWFEYKVPITNNQVAQANGGAPVQGQPPPNILTFQTNTLVIENLGRRAAEDVEIIHQRKPDHFQFSGSVVYEEDERSNGTHIIRLASIGPKEIVTLNIFAYANQPILGGVRSKDGPALNIPTKTIRAWPNWVNMGLGLAALLGLFYVFYWLVRAFIFISRANGMF